MTSQISTSNLTYESLGAQLVRDAAAANLADPILRHPDTGATVFIGSERAAKSEPLLKAKKISRIVNCQGSRGRNFFEHDPFFQYYRFDVSAFHDVDDIVEERAGDKAFQFFQPVFRFIDQELAAGNSVLIHCLAGAHRAGCTGVAYCIWNCVQKLALAGEHDEHVAAGGRGGIETTTQRKIFPMVDHDTGTTKAIELSVRTAGAFTVEKQKEQTERTPGRSVVVELHQDEIEINPAQNIFKPELSEKVLHYVQACRPVVDPIGRMRELLHALERGIASHVARERG
ncbi:unnamed protein product [Amoebophrya sp. A120]|nr:unnamed protein product [Amoebophrya sp. A120]|eukprot:GSA120T00017701001.1